MATKAELDKENAKLRKENETLRHDFKSLSIKYEMRGDLVAGLFHEVEEYHNGPRAKNEMKKNRQKVWLPKFREYLASGMPPEKAREKISEEMKEAGVRGNHPRMLLRNGFKR